MSRTSLPFSTGDVSALVRSLSGQLSVCDHAPSHVELLNMLVRAAGYRNYQHFRAQVAAQERLKAPQPSPVTVDHVQTQALARYFDASGRLLRWPGKFSHREPCLWVLWSKIPARRALTEPQINQQLLALHMFRDPALLRRELSDRGMVTRTADCREYRRVEKEPPPEALALIRHLRTRFAN
jgi:hypothetical protein